MAYKRTTKSTKLRNGGSIRRTNTYNTKTGKQTNSWSSSNGSTTTTRNTKGETWLTINQSGWITKRKISGHTQKPKKSRARKKNRPAGEPMSFKSVIIGVIVVCLILALL